MADSFPIDLILAEAEKIPLSRLKCAADALTFHYKNKSLTHFSKEEHRLAYLLCRFPATCAVLEKIFSIIKCKSDLHLSESFLDIGSGPGSALLAAAPFFPLLKKATLIEKDREMQAWSKKLTDKVLISPINFICGDFLHEKFESHDLVVLSYSLSEIPETMREKIFERAFESAKKGIILVEPGTPAGFALIRYFRDWMIKRGGHVVAPCTHDNECPISGEDWCHFSARLSRTKIHRFLKSGDLGFEDEKFAYVVVSKTPTASSGTRRILRHPKKRSGVCEFVCCSNKGLLTEVVSKRDGPLYKQARDFEWGDEF